MVLADSHEIPRAPCYSGGHTTDRTISITGLSPSTADHSKSFTYHPEHHAGSQLETATVTPTTPMMQRLTAITHHRFSLFRFRSPLLTESLLYFLFLRVLRLFHFPAFPPTSLYIQLAVTHHEDEPGFPIRKSSDHSPVIGSPRLIADSHVLHRLLMPRHPPCALNNLHTIKKKKNQETTQP